MPMDSFRDHCFKDGACLTPDGRPLEGCPTRRGDLERYGKQSSLLLAENLCLRGLEASVGGRMRDPFKDKCRDLEILLDQAIALPQVHVGAAKSIILEHALVKLNGIQEEKDIYSKSRLSYALKAQRVGIFWPALRSRIKSEPLTPEVMGQSHAMLCQSLVDFDQNYLYPIDKSHHAEKKLVIAEKTEREVFGLLSRLEDPDNFPWPAFAREEASQTRAEHNHDGYCIRDKAKIPFQVKESKGGSGYKNIVMIRHFDILRAMKRENVARNVRWEPHPGHEDYEWPSSFAYSEIVRGTKPDPISELLIEELRMGKNLDPHKRNALNLASQYIVSRLNEYEKTQLAK